MGRILSGGNLANLFEISICGEPFEALLRKRKELFAYLTPIPKQAIRRMEWVVDYDGTVGLTACLNSEITRQSLAGISRSIKLPILADQQAMAMLDLRCWRHTVRVDSRKGLSLYIERDWEPHLLRALCSWFDSSRALADSAIDFTSRSDFVVAIVGIHWRQQGSPRLRLYVVATPPHGEWRMCMEELSSILPTTQAGCEAPYLAQLLRKPRRACLINLEALDSHIGFKIELPDVTRCELTPLLNLSKPSTMLAALLPTTCDRLTYLGIRFRNGKPTSSTFYLSTQPEERSCGLRMS